MCVWESFDNSCEEETRFDEYKCQATIEEQTQNEEEEIECEKKNNAETHHCHKEKILSVQSNDSSAKNQEVKLQKAL